MAGRHLSIRIADDAFERLEAQSRRSGRTRSDVAKTLIEEGLRMEQHPGIVFRSGPAGRRAALAGGPDVWEVVRVVLGVGQRGEAAIARAADLAGLSPDQVRATLAYYAEFRDEVDGWIRRVDEEAAQAETAWHRQRALLDA